MTIGYGITLALAIGLLILYCALVKKKELWLGLLYVCVAVVNLGYFMLSMAKSVEFAIFCNDVAYLGSVFLCTCMLLTIVGLCGFTVKRIHVIICVVAGAAMFAVIATAGFLPWYYEDVWIESVAGATKLKKDYGVLHPVYMVYLLVYFATMIITIIYSIITRKVASRKLAGLVVGVVLGNLLVWFFEKFIDWEFEFLAVTYILSEIMLLFLYWMMQDYIPLCELKRLNAEDGDASKPLDSTAFSESAIGKLISCTANGVVITAREREILEKILMKKKRKDIALEMHLSENTVKTYTRSLYSKLGVSSREEIFDLIPKERIL